VLLAFKDLKELQSLVYKDLKEYRDQLDFKDDKEFKVLLAFKVPKVSLCQESRDHKAFKDQ
jgi:hypothetical protein